MLIKWSFIFESNHLAVDVRDAEEDKRIGEAVNAFVDLLLLPSPTKDAYVNLKFCRAIVREEIDETAVQASFAPEPAA